jgi:hypothetical protein
VGERAREALARGANVGEGRHRPAAAARRTRDGFAACRLQKQRPADVERGARMSRDEKDFLTGFGLAATLTRHIMGQRPSYTSAEKYVEDVADLHADAPDFLRRGVAVGCLSALGRK